MPVPSTLYRNIERIPHSFFVVKHLKPLQTATAMSSNDRDLPSDVHDNHGDPVEETSREAGGPTSMEDNDADVEEEEEELEEMREDQEEQDSDDDGHNDKTNRWYQQGEPFKRDQPLVSKANKKVGTVLRVMPRLLSGPARAQVGHLTFHLRLHRPDTINRLVLPPDATEEERRDHEQAVKDLLQGLTKYMRLYPAGFCEQTNRAFNTCFRKAGYGRAVRAIMKANLPKKKKLRKEIHRTLLPMTRNERVYNLMLKKLDSFLRVAQASGIPIDVRMVRKLAIKSYQRAKKEVIGDDDDSDNDSDDDSDNDSDDDESEDENDNQHDNNNKDHDKDDKAKDDEDDKNAICETGDEFEQDEEDDSLESEPDKPYPSSTVRVLGLSFPRETQEDLAHLVHVLGVHRPQWIQSLVLPPCPDSQQKQKHDQAVKKLIENLAAYAETYKDGLLPETNRDLLSCLRKAKYSKKECASLKNSKRLAPPLKRTVYRTLAPATTHDMLYNSMLTMLEHMLKEAQKGGKLITVQRLRSLIIRSYRAAKAMHKGKKRSQAGGRQQKRRQEIELERSEEIFAEAKDTAAADAPAAAPAAGLSTPPPPQPQRRVAPVTASGTKTSSKRRRCSSSRSSSTDQRTILQTAMDTVPDLTPDEIYHWYTVQKQVDIVTFVEIVRNTEFSKEEVCQFIKAGKSREQIMRLDGNGGGKQPPRNNQSDEH